MKNKKIIVLILTVLLVTSVFFIYNQYFNFDSTADASGYSIDDPVNIVFNQIEKYSSTDDNMINIEESLDSDDKERLANLLVGSEVKEINQRPADLITFAHLSFTDNEGWMRTITIFKVKNKSNYYLNFQDDASTYYLLKSNKLADFFK